MRKFLFIFIPLLVSTSLFAKPCGYYLSADAGIYQANFNTTYRDLSDVILQNIAQSMPQNGYTVGIAAGYRKIFTPMYLVGAELSGSYDNHVATFQSGASTSAFSDQIKVRNHANLVFVPGIQLSNCLAAYLKLGLSLAWVQDTLSSPAGFTPILDKVTNNKTTLGFTAGLQLEQMLTDKWSVFIEADYYDYAGMSLSNFQNFSATYSHSAHIYAYDALIGVSYIL